MFAKSHRRIPWVLLPMLLIAGGSAMVFVSLESTLGAERERQQHLVRRSAFEVLDNFSYELFNMYSSLSLDLYPVKAAIAELTLADVSEAAERYRSQSRFPTLLKDLVCVVLGKNATLEYWSYFSGSWHQGPAPDWMPRVKYPDDFPLRGPGLPASWASQPISLGTPVMPAVFRQYIRAPGSILATVIRFDAIEAKSLVLPSLIRQAFEGTSPDSYRATLVQGNGDTGTRADLLVPLFQAGNFETWRNHYQSRLVNLSASGIAPDLGGKKPDESWSVPAILPLAVNEEKDWFISVSLLPSGIEAYMANLEWRNLFIALAFFAVLSGCFTALYVSVQRTRRAVHRERDFLALVSHELKTPLSVIGSLSENMAAGLVVEQEAILRYGQLMHDENLRLGKMIHTILDLAAAREIRKTPKLTPINLESLCTSVIARHGEHARKLGTAVHLHVQEGVPLVISNADFLSAALDNLVGNAIEHGRSGFGQDQVIVDVQPRRRLARRGVVIRVQDGGPGVARRDRRRIFEPFQKGAVAVEGQIPGSGVGLSLVRANLGVLGGDIRVTKSRLGGACFSLWLRT